MVEDSCPLTPERERELAEQLREGGDKGRDAAGELIMAQSKWIMSVIVRLNPPKWIDPDVIFADIMIPLLESLSGYNPDKGRLTTFFETVVSRAAVRAIKKMLTANSRDSKTAEALSRSPKQESRVTDSEELVKALKELIDSDVLSQQSQVIIDRLMRGKSREEICSQLKIEARNLTASVRQIQNYVAAHLIQRDAPYEGLIPEAIVQRAKKSMTRTSAFKLDG